MLISNPNPFNASHTWKCAFRSGWQDHTGIQRVFLDLDLRIIIVIILGGKIDVSRWPFYRYPKCLTGADDRSESGLISLKRRQPQSKFDLQGLPLSRLHYICMFNCTFLWKWMSIVTQWMSWDWESTSQLTATSCEVISRMSSPLANLHINSILSTEQNTGEHHRDQGYVCHWNLSSSSK